MAVISNISNAYNVNSGKSHKKLSFDIGEKFLARIINIDGETNEAILKLLDGWQFSAQIKEPIDFTPNGLVKFVVEGYDKGKILLQLLSEGNEKSDQSLIEILEEQGINVKKEDYNILEKMIKYNMPLTKENISKMKTLVEFQNKINESPNEEEQFIEKYLNNKNIDISSKEGKNIKDILKGFFKEFKKLNSDEIFTLVQNKIELTEENIKSFNNINKGCMTIYEEILDGKSVLNEFENEIASKEIESNNINNTNNETQNLNDDLDENSNSTLNKNNAYNSKAYINDKKVMDGKEILRRLLEVEGENKNLSEENVNLKEISPKELQSENNNIQEKINSQDKTVETKTTTNSAETKVDEQYKGQEAQIEKKVLDKLNNKPVEIAKNVKEQIENKTNEMKQIIKHVLGENSERDSSILGKVFQSLQGKMNDFKVFNSLSNQYYYLDVPVNVNEQQYPCKLIIKDDRKNGKKIDSTNVKFAVCVKTINMGVVDAYIKVMNSNININIKCEDKWVKYLEKSKDKIINKLNEIGYMVGVKVDQRQSEVNLVECNDFFEDSDFARINFKV
ncbi:conserved hypothetical protein [Clostridium botulinum C str. Eklund]|nr:conserved hypothetical protein [Clostridium botulinum C str. Eklund]NEZ49522.1 hypothetical protein [Clostridium botulinum]